MWWLTFKSPAGACGRPRRLLAPAALSLVAAMLLACSGGNHGRTAGPVSNNGAAASAAAASPTSAGAAGTMVAATTAAQTQAAAATPAAQTPSRVETVKVVYDDLLDRYYKPLKSNDVLNNAWNGATQAARGGSGVGAPRLTGERNADWQAFQAAYQQLFAKANIQGADLAFGAVDAMATGLHDDHTYFLNPDDNKRRMADDNGGQSFVGVGIGLSDRAPWTVQSVVSGGPADKAGIMAGDIVTAVDGHDASGLSQRSLGDMLRGSQAGTTVRITISRAGATQNLTVMRAQIVQPAIQYKVLPDGIGYVALQNFADAYARFSDGRNIAETLDLALHLFEQAGVKGWIFDVRGNRGGSEQTLAEVAGRFLPDGIVLASTDREGQTTLGPVDGHLFGVQRPLAVLIDGQSGSAAELFAATMKEYGRAHLVGLRTAGAVNGALETDLPDGAGFQYTVVEARSGKDRKLLDGAGVTPDDSVGGDSGQSAILSGRTDTQFDHAKQWVLDQAKKQPAIALTPVPNPGTLPAADVRSKLTPDAATQNDVPAGPARARYGELVFTNPNELAVGAVVDAADPATFTQRVRSRHWQGGIQQYFGFGAPPPYTVEVDLYADVAGASEAVHTNDYATGFKSVAAPAKLGDETAAYTGYDAGAGATEIIWRHGRVVFAVWYFASSGQPGPDAALSVARAIDAHATAVP